jgi:photosystem II stability/assembly factor-like uncharacterized protein
MYEHLDDPSAPSPTSETLGAVLARAARLRRQRVTSALAVVAASALALGVGIGILMPRSTPRSAFTAFDSQSGVLAPGTLVPQSDLADVVFLDDLHGFALALHDQQTILAASTDAGDTWQVVNAHLPIGFPAQLEFADTAHGYLWGGAPSTSGTVSLWKTSDGGRTWAEAPLGPVVSDVSAIGPDVWAVVGTCPITSATVAKSCAASIEVSLDSGNTWSPTQSEPPVLENSGLSISDQDLELARITPVHVYVLAFTPTGAAGSSEPGRLVYSSDGGQTWAGRSNPCPRYFDFGEQIAASGTDDLWMMCASQASAGSQAKALYRSNDGGEHWKLVAAANSPVLSGNLTLPAAGGLPIEGYVSPYSLGHENLAVLRPTTAWLFPDRSTVLETTDGGARWNPVAELAKAGLDSGGDGNVVFVDSTHGWVCETGAGLWRTSDGVKWERLGP